MTGRDRIALHAQRTGWTRTDTTGDGAVVAEYVRGEYTLRVYFTMAYGVARAQLTKPGTYGRWISGGSGKADRVIDWMADPDAVFAPPKPGPL